MERKVRSLLAVKNHRLLAALALGLCLAGSAAADSEPDVEEQFLARERAAQLRDVVGRLEPQQQHLLALRFGAGLAFEEIAEIVGANPGAVRVRMHRIIEELRRRYPHDD